MGTSNLTLQVTDSVSGLTAAVTFTIAVQYSTGSAAVSTSFNTWPVVSGMTAAPTRIDVGDTTSLSVSATDPDGDELSYAWTSDCAGTDGRGGSNTATVVLQAGPPPTLAICPAVGFGGAIDQSQYGTSGEWEGVGTNTVNGTFTVGRAGILTGVEVQVARCDGTSPSSALSVQLSDGSGNDLGTSTLPASALAEACAGDVLSATAPGPGLFDLSSLCIPVTNGEQLTFTLSLSGGTPGTCDQSSGTCSNGGDPCMEDFDCQEMVGFRMTPTYDGTGAFLANVLVYQTYVE